MLLACRGKFQEKGCHFMMRLRDIRYFYDKLSFVLLNIFARSGIGSKLHYSLALIFYE
jgi:hypothetical protein